MRSSAYNFTHETAAGNRAMLDDRPERCTGDPDSAGPLGNQRMIGIRLEDAAKNIRPGLSADPFEAFVFATA
jgi:hypothetical protein